MGQRRITLRITGEKAVRSAAVERPVHAWVRAHSNEYHDLRLDFRTRMVITGAAPLDSVIASATGWSKVTPSPITTAASLYRPF